MRLGVVGGRREQVADVRPERNAGGATPPAQVLVEDHLADVGVDVVGRGHLRPVLGRPGQRVGEDVLRQYRVAGEHDGKAEERRSPAPDVLVEIHLAFPSRMLAYTPWMIGRRRSLRAPYHEMPTSRAGCVHSRAGRPQVGWTAGADRRPGAGWR